MSDRSAEIWSTRLQKELLALTTGDALDQQTQDNVVLPPFISLHDHQLDIAAGICKVSFVIDITNPNTQTNEESEEKIVVTLDTSMERDSDGKLNLSASAYPFKQPTVYLLFGASIFPNSSTIQNGNPVDIDCDWTPSLHMTDAVLNIGLKIKESILMGEPFHPAEAAVEVSDPVDDLVKGARRFGNFLSKSAFTLGAVVAPPSAVAPPAPPRNNPLRRKPKEQKRQASATSINIGDEINLMDAPWVDCQGLYSCKAIRRPGFLEDAIALAAKSKNNTEVRDDEDDDGDIPEDLGNYMRLQAGSLSKVCLSL